MKTSDEERAYQRKWRAEHPEKYRAILRRFRERHPDKVKEGKRRYYQTHKATHTAKVKAYRLTHREQLNAAERRAAKAPHRQEARRLQQWKRRYGLTADAAKALMASQNHACAICLMPFAQIEKLCVDHCHTSTVVRGFLCGYCNVGIAQFRDNPEFLRAAADYVHRHQPR